MAIAKAKQDLWRRESEILNFITDNKNLGFMQVKKETEGGSSRVGSRRYSHRRTRSLNDACLIF